MIGFDERIPWVSSSIILDKKVGKIPHNMETPPGRFKSSSKEVERRYAYLKAGGHNNAYGVGIVVQQSCILVGLPYGREQEGRLRLRGKVTAKL